MALTSQGQFDDESREGSFFGFRVGDRVDVAIPGEYIGRGEIVEVSKDPSRGYGTKLYPSFLVLFDNGNYTWANGVSLTKVKG